MIGCLFLSLSFVLYSPNWFNIIGLRYFDWKFLVTKVNIIEMFQHVSASIKYFVFGGSSV